MGPVVNHDLCAVLATALIAFLIWLNYKRENRNGRGPDQTNKG